MAELKNEETGEKKSLNFIEQIVENDLSEGKNGGRVQTRFPPEEEYKPVSRPNLTDTCT